MDFLSFQYKMNLDQPSSTREIYNDSSLIFIDFYVAARTLQRY